MDGIGQRALHDRSLIAAKRKMAADLLREADEIERKLEMAIQAPRDRYGNPIVPANEDIQN